MLPKKNSFWRYYSIILVCWLGFNDAIPYGTHTDQKRAPPHASWKLKDSVPTKNSEPVSGSFELDEGSSMLESDWSDKLLKLAPKGNRNININVGGNSFDPFGLVTSIKMPWSTLGNPENAENDCTNIMDSSMDIDDKIAHCRNEENINLSKKDEPVLQKCSVSGRRSDKDYGQSFSRDGPPINVEGEFKVATEAEAKKTSNVYNGEDITLCWIELITIREDPAFNPPKKLVTREFSISFENSDTISERDMDCSRIRGEILPGEEKTVCESSLDEVIVDDTKRSRVVETEKVNQEGLINIRQYKKVKCATGNVVSKAIYEWPDGTDNPKKRVEIKVAPSVQNVHHEKDGAPSLCTPKKAGPDSQDEVTSPPASGCPIGESCEITKSCEDTATCNETKTPTSCEDDTCASTLVPENIISTPQSPIPDRGTQNEPNTIKNITEPETVISSEHDAKTVKNCSQENCTAESNDAGSVMTHCPEGDCTVASSNYTESGKNCSQGDCTVVSSNHTETSKNCSQGDCTAESSYETSDEETNQSAHLCTNDHCTSDEELTIPQEEKITEGTKECREGSESCECRGSSCLDQVTEKPNSLVVENKVTEATTLSGIEMPQITHNDTNCDGQSSECSNSSISSSEDEDTISPAISVSNDTEIAEESTVDDKENSPEQNDIVPTTSSTENITVADTSFSTPDIASTEILSESTVPFCLDPTSEDCVTTGSTPFEDMDQSSTDPEEHSVTTEIIMPLSTTEEHPMIDGTEISDTKVNSSCEQDSTGKSCESTGSPDRMKLEVDNVTSELPPQSTNTTHLTSSDEPENTTHLVDLSGTSIPITGTVSEIPWIEDSTELPDNLTATDEGSLTNEDSSIDTTHKVLENVEGTTEACESSEDCSPTKDNTSAIDPSDSSLTNSVASIESCENSNCNDTSEPCLNATSTNSCEDCAEDSSSENCVDSESSEQIESNELINKTITPTTESAGQEAEHFSTDINNVTAITATRRTTVTSALPQEPEGKHKLALRIKVLLEHINEKDEKEKLVQVEKHLLLDEMLDEHGNHSLVWHLKSLNNSMNIETLKSIFHLTDFDNLTETFSHVTEFNGGGLEKVSTLKPQDESESKSNQTSSRRKRDISGLNKIGNKTENITDATKVQAIKESLPGVNEDFQKGLGHVLGEISHEFNREAPKSGNKSVESSTSTIMKILANPGDKRVHSRRRKRATNVKDVPLKELDHPVNGEEIGRWSNERFVMAGDGGRVRSLLEFQVMKDPSDDLRRIHLGS